MPFIDPDQVSSFKDPDTHSITKDEVDKMSAGDYFNRAPEWLKAPVGAAEAGLNAIGAGGGAILGTAAGLIGGLNDIVHGNKPQDYYGKLLEAGSQTGTNLLPHTKAGDYLNDKMADFMNNIGIPAMGIHIPTAGGVLPGNASAVKAAIGRVPKEVVPGEQSLGDRLNAISNPPKATSSFVDPDIAGAGAFDKIAESQISGAQSPIRQSIDPLQFVNDQLAKQKQEDTQRILDQRQAQMQQDVARQQQLDFNAAERARQQQAGTGYPEWAEQQDTAKAQQMSESARNIDPMAQHELFDQSEMGRVANPYEAKLGDWRVDENGIPIKADLSMEANNLENPLQRNLWGDELERTRNPVGQEATLFDQNGLQEGVPLTQAMDSMPWAQRRGAINSELTGAIEPTNQLQAAIAQANRQRTGSLNPSMRSGELGGVNIEDIAKGLKSVYSKWEKTADSLGKINLANTSSTTKDEFARQIPGMGKAVDGIHVRPEAPDTAIPKMLSEGKDGPFLIKSIQQGLEMTAEKTRSGLMRYVSDWLQWKDKKSDYEYNTTVKPTERSIANLKNDMIPLAKIMSKEMFNKERFTSEQLQSLGVSDKVIKARAQLRDILDNVADTYDKGRAMLGLDPMKRGEAYLAATRSGNYHVVLNGLDKDGKSYPAWHQQFDSVREAYKAVNFFKEIMKDNPNLDIKSLEQYTPKSTFSHWAGGDMYRGSNASTKVPKDVLGAYHEVAKLIDPGSDAAKAISQAIEEANTRLGYNVGTTSDRFLNKSNIRGFEGDMPWLSEKENATRLFNAQFNTIKEGMNWSHMQEALANIKKVLSNEDLIKQQPNNMAMVKEVMNQQLGLSKSILKDAEDFVMHNAFGMSRKGLKDAAQSLKSFTYLQQLGANVGYFVGTPLTALNSVGMALRERGLGALSPSVFVKAMYDGSTGIIGDLAHEIGHVVKPPMTEIGKQALQYAEDNGITTKMLFSAGHETPNVGRIPGRGEMTYRMSMALPEKVSRLFPFMAFVHHLNEMGTYKDINSLFKRAEELTNTTQVNFRSSERPTIVGKLGTAGNLGYVYKAPIFNYFHQLSTFGRDAVGGKDAATKAKGALALAGMLGMTAYLGGALATPMLDEMDGAYNLIKEVHSKYFPETYKPDLGLKGSIISKMDKSSAYGAVSAAMGSQMSSRFAPNTIDMEHPLSGMAPVTTEMREQGALATFAGHPSWNNAVQGLYANSPPLLRGQLETNLDKLGVRNPFKGAKTPQGQTYLKTSDVSDKQASYVRTPDQEFKKSLGLTDLSEAKTKDLRYIAGAEEGRVNTAIQGNVSKMFENMVDNNPSETRKYAAALIRLNPSKEILNSAFDKKLSDYAYTPEQKDAMRTSAVQTLLKLKRLQDAAK